MQRHIDHTASSISTPATVRVEREIAPALSQCYAVTSIQEELAQATNLMKQGRRSATKGVLISGYSPEVIREIASSGGQLYTVSLTGVGYDGYVLAANAKRFGEQLTDATISWHTTDFERTYAPRLQANQFAYIDQIGTRFRSQRQHIGATMMRAFESDHRGMLAAVLIMTAPLCNTGPLAFFKGSGYRSVCTISLPKFGTIEPFVGELLVKEL